MLLGGPPKSKEHAPSEAARPWRILRVMPFCRPYRRQLCIGIGCVVFVALTYSINIMALLPVITLIADDRGIPAWVYQGAAEKRADITFNVMQDEVRVVKLGRRAAEGKQLLKYDVLLGARSHAGAEVAAADFFRWAADPANTGCVTLRMERPKTDARYEAEIDLAPAPRAYRLLRETALHLPQEPTDAARMKTLVIILGSVLGISLLGGTARFFGEYLISLVAGRALVGIRRRMYDRVLKLPLSFFSVHGTSDIVSRFVQDSQEIYRGVSFVFAKSLREPLKAIFVFIVAMFIDWRITLITVVSAPGAALLIRQFGKIIRKANKRLLMGYGRMLAALEGALTGIRVVKGYTMEAYERRHLHAVDQQMLKHQLKIERIDAMSSPIFEAVGGVVATAAILYFALLMFEGTMTFAKFATLAACMAGMFDPVRKMSSFYNRLERSNAAVDRVFEVLNMPDELTGAERHAALPPLERTIEFRGVRFIYPGGEAPALDGVNLTIRRGERVAFVGPNGSGKTTLLSLLMRFFEPTEGDVLFDGRPVRAHSISSLRRQMSLVTQDTVIFSDTLANNIAYGDEQLLRRIVLRQRHPERRYPADSDDERIVEAATAAYADEFIREKPEGYDTLVGEHGVTLSGGQKQRIAIARAILRNAPIFIFDEATSQIDAESEMKIHDAVEKFLEGRTALIIAHRLSTILQADRIVVMDRGRIVDVGNHHELIKRCTLYQKLYGSQIVRDAEPVGAS